MTGSLPRDSRTSTSAIPIGISFIFCYSDIVLFICMRNGIKKLFAGVYVISLLFSLTLVASAQLLVDISEAASSVVSGLTGSGAEADEEITATGSEAPVGSIERGGGQSGPVEEPPFRNIDPNSSFVGPFTGPDTAPLQGAYTAPLLQVADRQIAFQILVNFFLGVIGVVAVLYLVTNGYRYVMARGDEAQMTQAKKGITFAIIGLLFVLAAYTIVATVLNFGARPVATPGVGIGIGVSF